VFLGDLRVGPRRDRQANISLSVGINNRKQK
jgi:hypothetical protein